jgi:hypothetical protein
MAAANTLEIAEELVWIQNVPKCPCVKGLVSAWCYCKVVETIKVGEVPSGII